MTISLLEKVIIATTKKGDYKMLIYKKHIIDIMYGYVSVIGYNRMFTSIEDAKKFVDTLMCDSE